jgi:hypothetical protein
VQGKYIEGKKHSWWAPEVLPCSEEFTNLPSMDIIEAEILKFVSLVIEGGDDSEEIEDGDRVR